MGDVVLLVTNGGPHPADKWASIAAAKITDLIQVDELSDSDTAAVARKAKPRFAITLSDSLEQIFSDAMTTENGHVASGEITARNAPFDVDGFANSAVALVVSDSNGTPFSAHFSDSGVQSAIKTILQQLIIDAANIARSWALDAKGL